MPALWDEGAMQRFFITVMVEGRPERACLYPVFLHVRSAPELHQLVIYASNKFECDSQCYDFEELVDLVRKGNLRTSVEEGEMVYVPWLITFRANRVGPIVEEEEFLKEVQDIVRHLNDQPTSLDVCREAYTKFLAAPSEQNRSLLRTAFERIPEHCDVILLSGGQRLEDLRRTIYGEQC